jgi:hypothetical protein
VANVSQERRSDWEIVPFEAVGPIRFGMPRSEIHRALGETPRPFKKGLSENLTEAFKEIGVHVYYDGSGRVEFVEAFSPSRLRFRGVDLWRENAAEVLAELRNLGLRVRDDGAGGLWFDDCGFSLYSPNGRTEGVSAFRRGYPTGA